MTLQTILAQHPGLSAAGWTLMIACIGLVCGLMTFCFYRVLRKPQTPEQKRDSNI